MQTLEEMEKQRFAEFTAKVESRINEIKSFIKAEMTDNRDRDFWSEFNSEIDVHFCENDDPQAENFGEMEFWTYPIVNDEIDTSVYCEVKL